MGSSGRMYRQKERKLGHALNPVVHHTNQISPLSICLFEAAVRHRLPTASVCGLIGPLGHLSSEES